MQILAGEQGGGDYQGGEEQARQPRHTAQRHAQLLDGDEELQQRDNRLGAETGHGRAARLIPRYQDDVDQDVDHYACHCRDIQFFQTAVGGQQRAEHVSEGDGDDARNQQGEDARRLLHVIFVQPGEDGFPVADQHHRGSDGEGVQERERGSHDGLYVLFILDHLGKQRQ